MKMGRRELQVEISAIAKARKWVQQTIKVLMPYPVGTSLSSVYQQHPIAKPAPLLRAFFGHEVRSVNVQGRLRGPGS